MIDKKIIFYILVFLLFYIFVKGSGYISMFIPIPNDIIILLLGIVFTSLIYLLNKMNDTKDNFHFELTPQKKCDGGNYMYTSDPEKQKLCSSFTPEELSMYQCPNGAFHGRPVWWNRTNESNANWQNTMCDSGLDDFSTRVL